MKWLAALLAAYCIAAALSLPLTEVPVIDDWAYTYSVDQMLQTGQFRVVEYSCRYNLLQVLWGALFTLPAGLSFAALRLSTFTLGAVGIAAFYDLLRRRTGDERLAVCAAAVLAFNPLYFRLSLSFMTDVPLLALVSVGFWMFERALRSRGVVWLGAALVVVAAAYLVRELAIIAPIAILLVLALVGRGRFTTPALIGVTALTALGTGIELLWIRAHGATWGLETRTEGLLFVLDVPPGRYAWALFHMLLTTAALVSPLSLAVLTRKDAGRVLMIGGACAGAALLLAAIPFGAKEVLSPLGLGMSRALMPGAVEISVVGQAIRAAAFAAACASLAVLVLALFERIADWRRRPSAGASAADAHEGIDLTWTLFGLGQIAALMILWLWQDRYDLVLIPSALWLLALRAQRVGWSSRVVTLGIVLFALIGVLGTRDDFALNRTAWEAEAWLREQGVEAREIDGGYVLNGWRLYTHADRFAPGFPPERVPFLFSRDELPYLVSTTPLSGAEVLATMRWPRTWLGEATVYALRR